MDKLPFNPGQHVARVLMLISKNLSESAEKFVHWSLGGFALGLTYLIGQTGFQIPRLQEIGWLFMLAAIAGVIQRYLAMGVSAIAQTFHEVEKLNNPDNVRDAVNFILCYIRSMPRVMQCIPAFAANDLLNQNLARIPRYIFFATIAQCILSAAIAALLLRAAYIVIMTANSTAHAYP